MARKLDLLGEKFFRLLVIEKAPPIGTKKRTAWICKCDCGSIKVVKTEDLRTGNTKSCGCWNNEQRSNRAEKMYEKNRIYSPLMASAKSVHKNSYSDMPFEDFYELCKLDCYYCGAKPENKSNVFLRDKKSHPKSIENGTFVYNGLDRVDNSLPHSKENCVPCCKYCNFSKRERSIDEFYNWIDKVYFLKKSRLEM